MILRCVMGGKHGMMGLVLQGGYGMGDEEKQSLGWREEQLEICNTNMSGLERRGVLVLSVVEGEFFWAQDLRHQGIKTETGTEDKERGVRL